MSLFKIIDTDPVKAPQNVTVISEYRGESFQIPILARIRFYPKIVCLTCGLFTSALLWLSFFPMAWGWIGWVAMVPFLFLIRPEGGNRVLYVAAWASGLVF